MDIIDVFGMKISRDPENGFLSITDLLREVNRKRALNRQPRFNHLSWFHRQSTKDLIADIEKKHGKAKINSLGRGSHTMAHPILFIEMAIATSPLIKMEVYEFCFSRENFTKEIISEHFTGKIKTTNDPFND